MLIKQLKLKDALLLTPEIHTDSRGIFYEAFNKKTFQKLTGHAVSFVQDNHSISHKGVIRGLHYQYPKYQAKLVRVIKGTIYDVIVDIRKDSPTFGMWEGIELSSDNRYELWVPAGFAHGFQVLTETAECIYKVTEHRYKEYEGIIRWNDSSLNITWPLSNSTLSEKDASAPEFKDIDFK